MPLIQAAEADIVGVSCTERPVLAARQNPERTGILYLLYNKYYTSTVAGRDLQ
jgi:hypothetical protein